LSKNRKFKAAIIAVLVIVVLIVICIVLNVKKANSKVQKYDSGVIIQPLENDDSVVEEEKQQTTNNIPDSSPVPEKPQKEKEESVTIIEDQGDLEMILPEGMDSDGF